jgi:hypothetical protein
MINLVLFSKENIYKEYNDMGYIKENLKIKKDNNDFFLINNYAIELKSGDIVKYCIFPEINEKKFTIICTTSNKKSFIFEKKIYKKKNQEITVEDPFFNAYFINQEKILKYFNK